MAEGGNNNGQDGHSARCAELAGIYKDLVSRPVVEEAWLLSGGGAPSALEVLVKQSTLDPTDGVPHAKSTSLVHLAPRGTPQSFSDVSRCAQVSVSPSGSLHAFLYHSGAADPKPGEPNRLELWSSETGARVRVVDLTGKHGQVLAQDTFGSISWSADETRLAYVADRPAATGGSLWPGGDAPSSKKTRDGEEDTSRAPGEKFLYRDVWGERLASVARPTIVVVELTTGKVSLVEPILKGSPESWAGAEIAAYGQCRWTPQGRLVFVAWPLVNRHKRRLGITFCTNRESAVFLCEVIPPAPVGGKRSMSVEAVLVSPATKYRSSLCPRISPDGDVVVFASTDNMELHNSAFSVGFVRLEDGGSHPGAYTELPGLKVFSCDGVNNTLPQSCFLGTSKFVVNTLRGFRRFCVSCDIASLKVSDIGPDFSESGVALCAGFGHVLVSASNPGISPTLRLYSANGCLVQHPALARTTPVCLERHHWQIHSDGKALSLLHDGSHKRPLLVTIHGGPHSAHTSLWQVDWAFFFKAGYDIMAFNYTGSTGTSDEEMARLTGNIGILDVEESRKAIGETVCKYPQIDTDRIYLFGGSHGGFLIGHLIFLSGQDSSPLYRSASVRNPVWNISTMYDTSDIPDWAEVELGSSAKMRQTGEATTRQEMLEHSPAWREMHSIGLSVVPTAVFIGLDDKRVPNEQGLAMYRALNRRNVRTTLRALPGEGHGFVNAEQKGEWLVDSALWFESS